MSQRTASYTVPLQYKPASEEIEREWVGLHHGIGAALLFKYGNNYYVGANIPGKKREIALFFGGTQLYDEYCRKAAEERAGFVAPSTRKSAA